MEIYILISVWIWQNKTVSGRENILNLKIYIERKSSQMGKLLAKLGLCIQ